MPRARVGNTTFARGQLDTQLQGRIDTQIYQQGVKTLTNFRITAGGSIMRRPGTKFLAQTNGTGRLVPFVLTNAEEYILHFQDSSLDIYSSDGTLQDTIVIPYDADEVWELDFAQNVTLMVLCHKDHKPRVLVRTALNTFSFDEIEWETQTTEGGSSTRKQVFEPFYQFTGSDDYLSPSGKGAAGTINVQVVNEAGTAGLYFDSADWVGTQLRYAKRIYMTITQVDAADITALRAIVQVEGGGIDNIRLIEDAFKSEEGTKVIYVSMPFHGFKDGASVTFKGVNYTTEPWANADVNATRTISVVDRDEFKFTHTGANATDSVDGGGPNIQMTSSVPPDTIWWDESAYSVVRGWPSACVFYEARLGLAGGPSIPDTTFLSRTGQPFNFDAGEGLASEAVPFSLGTGDIHEIRFLVPGRNLQLLTSTAEFHIPQDNDSGPITPTSVRAAHGTSYGCANVKPVFLDGNTIFVQANGKAVREYTYSQTQYGVYESNSLSVIASDVINTPVQMAVSAGTALGGEQYLYVLNTDGTMAVLHVNKDQEVAGWGVYTVQLDNTPTSGAITSIIAMNQTLFLLVARDTGTGGTVYHLEQLTTNNNWTLDSAIESSTIAMGNTFSGFSEYAGQTVSVVDLDTGTYIGEKTVDGSGQIDVGEAGHTTIIAGFNYVPYVEMLPPELQLNEGWSPGEWKAILRSSIRFHGTHNVSVAGTDIEFARLVTALPYTGAAEFHHRGYDVDPTLTITQSQPEPLHILSVHQEVDF